MEIEEIKVVLGNDTGYFCLPCGTIKMGNEPSPMFKPKVDSSSQCPKGGKMKLEVAYSNNFPICAMCKELI